VSHAKTTVSLNTQQFHALYGGQVRIIEQALAALLPRRSPLAVYDPMRYVIAAGGKRFRAVLTLLSCEAVGTTPGRALPAAAAIELLHNFTLVHDDVMDHADTRRGRPTVHTRWDANTAILAGDQMAAYAYDALLRTPSPRLPDLLRVFTGAFIDVCDGQGLDKEFETRGDVSLPEYMEMIRKKTACVIAAAAELGAIAGDAPDAQRAALRRYGEQLGMAFQVQDDLLDIAGSSAELGKPIGGDIIERKKTFLYLTALRRGSASDRALLRAAVPPRARKRQAHLGRVKALYERRGVLDASRDEILRRTARARRALAPLPPTAAKAMLLHLADQLQIRTR
jgi:geranylgeranyl diphosphate synthase type II